MARRSTSLNLRIIPAEDAWGREEIEFALDQMVHENDVIIKCSDLSAHPRGGSCVLCEFKEGNERRVAQVFEQYGLRLVI